jgi:triosephosphate isomerase (TIM)
MNTTLFEAMDLAEAILRPIADTSSVQVVLFPPFPNLQVVHEVIAGSRLELGGQDVFWEDFGAYTGEVSAPMLRGVGCQWILVGHSERRRIVGESSEIVNRKLKAVLRNGLQAILAIGETDDERQDGRTEVVLREQLGESLEGIVTEQMTDVVLAYEPVWAIGTGKTASPEQAREAHEYVREVLTQIYGAEVARDTRIQYGGSVTASNAVELLSQPGIDGALVGGASLKPDEFAAIVKAASSI